jgi:hypothetical protein
MQLERMLNDAKHAATKRDCRLGVERLCYASSLKSALKQHMDLGCRHPLAMNRKIMESAGLPVVSKTSSCKRRGPDAHRQPTGRSWVNRRVHEALRVHGDASTMSDLTTHYWQRWNSMSSPEQKAALLEFGRPAAPLTDGGGDGEPLPVPPPMPMFYCGDGDQWPVSPKVVSDFVGQDTGFCNAAWSIRKEAAEKLVVRDDGRLDGDKMFHRRAACNEVHPGLCASADSDVYTESCRLASHLERWCKDQNCSGKFIRIGDPCEPPTSDVILFVAGTRARRAYAPQAVVFALCSVLSSDGEAWAVALDEDTLIPGTFRFLSAWSVAKVLLRACLPVMKARVGCMDCSPPTEYTSQARVHQLMGTPFVWHGRGQPLGLDILGCSCVECPSFARLFPGWTTHQSSPSWVGGLSSNNQCAFHAVVR